MTKITSDHLARSAYVYVRQSSMDQLLHNPESRRRQYALTTRASALGWDNAIVIDDDLGRSGGGTARPGFERSAAATRARCLPLRPRAWPATGATGTPFWSSAPWSAA